MAKNKKLTIIGIITIFFVCATLFLLAHKTYIKYNDWWVMGKTIEEVEARYGKADRFREGEYGYFIKIDWINFYEEHYIMITDNNGKIVRIYRGASRGLPKKERWE